VDAAVSNTAVPFPSFDNWRANVNKDVLYEFIETEISGYSESDLRDMVFEVATQDKQAMLNYARDMYEMGKETHENGGG